MLHEYDLRIHFYYYVGGASIANKGKDLLVNEAINVEQVLVIGPSGEQLGVKTKEDALTLAEYAGFDLVLINDKANPPVCKLIDYNKFKYEKRKKLKESQKKQKEVNFEVKEFRLSVKIDTHDFDTKTRKATKHLQKGNKVKVTIRFRGREMMHTDLGKNVLLRFAEALNEVSDVEQEPKLDGRLMLMLLVPKKK